MPQLIWTKLLGTNGTDTAESLTTGSDGAIYVAGTTGGNLDGQTNSGGLDAFVTKYNTDGTKAWTKLLGSSASDYARSLTTGSDGAIYVAGETTGNLDGQTNSGGNDAFVTKYNTDGTKAWTRLLGTTGSDGAESLTTGSDGAIYVAGYTNGNLDGQTNSGGNDAFVTKYNTDGTKAWTRLLGTTGSDGAESLTTGSDGAIYVAGETQGNLDGQTNNGTWDAFVTKYNTDGTKAWTRLLGTTGSDGARSLTTGSDGAIYVAGYTNGNLDGQTNSGGNDAFVTKYNTDGTKAWTKLLGTTGIDGANSLTTGSDGAIYVAGTTGGNLDGQTNSGSFDAFVTKYNTDGTKAWTKLLGSSASDYARSLTTGSDGAIYVAGYTDGNLNGQTNSGGLDAFVIQLNVNEAPVITSAATATFAENGTGTVYTVTATGVDANTTLTYSLSGTDANLFDINNGIVTFKTAPNFELPSDSGANNVYDINVIASDGILNTTKAVAITVTNVNEAPVITSAATATFAENGTGTVYTVTATDADAGATLIYSLAGTDANRFNITNGVVTFQTAPNFEVPTDNGANNVYDINVIATDNGALTATQAVAITVTNVNDAPVITSAATATFAENGTGTVYTVTATDADAGATLTYSLSGTDANLFNLNNGVVTFKTAPNFELPSDSGANNVYDINVIASDGILTATKAVAITVTNVNDDFQSALSYTLNSSQQDLILTGNGNINGTGNSLNNTLFGNSGNNLLNGGAGADSLVGNAGNDTLMGGVGADSLTGETGNDWYWVDNASDSVIELANEGTDKVFTTISYTLTDNVEDLALQETAANINGTGNSLNNTITDNTKDNLLDGGAGNDIIRASRGNDTLTGGLGTDTLTGGLGNDRFVYSDLTHSLLAGIDSIKDFNNGTETDRFVVSTARSVFNNVGVVSGLNATAIGSKLTITNFGANAAALFTIGSKSYVAINDSTAGFSATSDAIVDITGYKGTLSTSSFVTV